MIEFNQQNIIDYARGAALLGAGGGGDPYVGRLLAQQAIAKYGAPKVISVDQVPDQATVISVAMIGAPTVLVEKACSGADLDYLIEETGRQLDKKIDALMPIEIGGVNSCLPIVAACRTGLPLVNCDGMGRAFPCLEMVTFNVYGQPISPVVITDEHLNSVVLRTHSAIKAEQFARSAIAEMGLSAMLSCYPQTGQSLKRFAVRDTMSCALNIGMAIRMGRQQSSPVEALLNELNQSAYYQHARVVCDGKITDVHRETKQGFNFGHCTVAPLNSASNRVFPVQLSFQNEFLSVKQQEQFIATVPDIIAVIDRENAEPITTDALRFGQRVKVLVMDVPEIMRTEAALKVFGPRCFGLDTDYQPSTGE